MILTIFLFSSSINFIVTFSDDSNKIILPSQVSSPKIGPAKLVVSIPNLKAKLHAALIIDIELSSGTINLKFKWSGN